VLGIIARLPNNDFEVGEKSLKLILFMRLVRATPAMLPLINPPETFGNIVIFPLVVTDILY
jgi:hypothetical protein